MVDSILQLLGIIGIDTPLPATLAELIPYLLRVAVGLGLLAGVFSLFRGIVQGLTRGRNPF